MSSLSTRLSRLQQSILLFFHRHDSATTNQMINHHIPPTNDTIPFINIILHATISTLLNMKHNEATTRHNKVAKSHRINKIQSKKYKLHSHDYIPPQFRKYDDSCVHETSQIGPSEIPTYGSPGATTTGVSQTRTTINTTTQAFMGATTHGNWPKHMG